ncbi:unnamed protein product [Lactuca virosa]|uniref:Nucleotidyl transferase domain-containing protein n=1 Tax=Lactuca virosa TaxID=75947 RepID=A0AAU9M9X2_9ASTR|nr:unnamed protein product [Lactuca virosa]
MGMMSSDERAVAVIMVGGPTKGTRFRPLSLNIPKPLFPLAGQAMVHHPISACKKIPNLAQIYLIGFYEEREFALYVSSISMSLKSLSSNFITISLLNNFTFSLMVLNLSLVSHLIIMFSFWIILK